MCEGSKIYGIVKIWIVLQKFGYLHASRTVTCKQSGVNVKDNINFFVRRPTRIQVTFNSQCTLEVQSICCELVMNDRKETRT